MSELIVTSNATKAGDEAKIDRAAAPKKLPWETPKLEDVSEQVMAQPYIRFT